MDENFVGDEADAVPAAEDERFGKELADELGQVDHLGHVGQIIDAESDGIGLEAVNFALEIAVVEDLKIDQSHLMPGALDGGGDAFHSQRFQTKVNFRIKQRTGMHQQYFHGCCSLSRRKGVNCRLCVGSRPPRLAPQ